MRMYTTVRCDMMMLIHDMFFFTDARTLAVWCEECSLFFFPFKYLFALPLSTGFVRLQTLASDEG